MVWNTFFHVCPFDREGGGDLSDLGNAYIEPTHFKKGLPLVAKRSVLFKIRKAEKGPSQVSVMQPWGPRAWWSECVEMPQAFHLVTRV